MSLNSQIKKLSERIKLHKMLFISDQAGIMQRYIREKQNWDIHLNEVKNFIKHSSKTKKKNKVVVFGSGWLLDLPLIDLSENFKKVVLIDIYHPKQIQKKAKQFPNITVQTDDLTGGLIDFFYNHKKQKVLISTIESFKYKIPKNTDFVISLNIMCQLHIILIDYLRKHNRYSNQELKMIEKQIQLSHINILPKEKSCLITDFEEEIYDEEDNLVGINPLLHIGLPTGSLSKNWQWKFDSLMTYRPNAKTYFNTTAIDF